MNKTFARHRTALLADLAIAIAIAPEEAPEETRQFNFGPTQLTVANTKAVLECVRARIKAMGPPSTNFTTETRGGLMVHPLHCRYRPNYQDPPKPLKSPLPRR